MTLCWLLGGPAFDCFVWTSICALLRGPTCLRATGSSRRCARSHFPVSFLFVLWFGSNGLLSNFEYLMHLNAFAGRTSNDLTQCDYATDSALLLTLNLTWQSCTIRRLRGCLSALGS